MNKILVRRDDNKRTEFYVTINNDWHWIYIFEDQSCQECKKLEDNSTSDKWDEENVSREILIRSKILNFKMKRST